MTQKTESLEYLKKALKKGTTIYYFVSEVSRSGMSRKIKFFYAKNNAIIDITYYIAEALEYKYIKNSLLINGCGMDMGFHVVYSLGLALWPPKKNNKDFSGGYALKSFNL